MNEPSKWVPPKWVTWLSAAAAIVTVIGGIYGFFAFLREKSPQPQSDKAIQHAGNYSTQIGNVGGDVKIYNKTPPQKILR
jgi:hypothetical protein